MFDQPAVSVLMTVYNSEKYIARAIESILNQTFTDFEFIIIDDQSSDKTREIIEFYRQKDKRLVFFKNENNLGIIPNRNKLISLAKGKYIAWQDADDISLNYRIEKLFKFLEANLAVGICGGWLKFFNDSQNTLGVRKYKTDDSFLRKTIFRYSPVAQPAAMIRKEALTKAGSYDENLLVAEDLDMSFRIGENYKFANLPEVLVKYRQQNKSITFKKLKELEKNTLKIRLKFARNKNYQFCLSDLFYNLFQFLTLYLFPANLRVGFFNLIRNSK